MDRARIAFVGELPKPAEEQGSLLLRGRQEAWPGHRRERHRHLQFRIIASPGAVEGIGPGMIEDIFPHAV